MPTNPSLLKAIAQSEKAKIAYDLALESGADTAAAREALRQADLRLSQLEGADAEVATPAPEDDEALRAEVEDTLAIFEEAADGRIADLLAFAVPLHEVDEQRALDLVLARRGAAAHAGRVSAHQERLNALRARLLALVGDRKAIISRRSQGDQRSGDGASLALNDADREGLAGLIAAAEQDAPGPIPGTREALEAWHAACREAEQKAIVAVIEQLQSKLVQAAALLSGVPFSGRPEVARELRQAVMVGGGKW